MDASIDGAEYLSAVWFLSNKQRLYQLLDSECVSLKR
jgi:hypothetical protein